MKRFVVLIFVLFIAQCKSAEKKNEQPVKEITVPANYKPAETTQLTFKGDNGEGYFSPDGEKIIFQSKKRSSHENTQIYILDLKTNKEKRVIHDDGENTCSYFSPDGKKIIYASTTDEIKENVDKEKKETPSTNTEGKKKYEWKFLPYDIYRANVDGSQIERLTKTKGYDAEAVISSDGKRIVFTSIRDGDLELYSMTTDGKNQKRLTNKKGYDGGGVYSPNGKKLAWRGFHDEKGNAQLYVANSSGQNTKQITDSQAINWCPAWHPDGKRLIFSSNREDRANFELYMINADGTCLKRLTYTAGADILPVFSPDGKKIAFTSNRNGSNHLYMMDFVEPTDCLTDKP